MGDGFVADVERLEDGLVDQPADGVVAAPVEVVEIVADDLQREIKGRRDVVVVDAQAGDERFGVLAALPDADLLFVEKFAADALVVVHVQELPLLLFELLQHALSVLDLLLGDGDPLAEIVGDRPAEFFAFVLTERDARVVILDRGLYEVNGLVAL